MRELSVGRQRLTKLVCVFNGRAADGAVAAKEDENPDDAALGKTGIGAMLLLPWICHTQLQNLGEETASTLFPVTLSCIRTIIEC